MICILHLHNQISAQTFSYNRFSEENFTLEMINMMSSLGDPDNLGTLWYNKIWVVFFGLLYLNTVHLHLFEERRNVSDFTCTNTIIICGI